MEKGVQKEENHVIWKHEDLIEVLKLQIGK